MYMNEYEIERATARYAGHPILGPATRTLHNLMDAANSNSDGWCYWPKPARAAKSLMLMIGTERAYMDDPERTDVTVEQYRRVLAPVKAFRTRSGIPFDVVNVTAQPGKPAHDVHLDYGRGFKTPVCGFWRDGTTLTEDRAAVTCADCKRKM